jgi:hypothetical protein
MREPERYLYCALADVAAASSANTAINKPAVVMELFMIFSLASIGGGRRAGWAVDGSQHSDRDYRPEKLHIGAGSRILVVVRPLRILCPFAVDILCAKAGA